MDTDSLYMALGDDKVEELIRPEMKIIWEMNRENDCRDDLRADEHYIFFPQTVVSSIGNSIRGHLDFSKKILDVLRPLLFVLKLIVALMNRPK